MKSPDLEPLQAGDEAAWDAAFDSLRPTVFGVAQVGDRSGAEIRVILRQGERLAETSIPVETDLRLAWGKAREFAETALPVR